jgi:fructose-specific phosphotransferase system IIC component
MIAAYIAYSIADRPGLAPAFIVGLVAAKMGTGFLGGMLVGILVGYLVQWLKKIPMSMRLMSVKSLILIPFVATAVVGLILIYVVGSPIKAMTVGLTAWLKGMSGTNAVLMAMILGAMMAVDMGGPVNKIAYAFGVAAFSSGGYAASTAMLMAIGIPPLGMFVATLLNKKLYSDSEIENGRSALIMGLVGITEGTIPFAVADPVRVIPSIIVGTASGCAVNAFFGTTQKTMLSTVMAIPFSSNALLYTVAILVGVLVTALMVNFLKSMGKKNKPVETEAE